MGGLGAREPHLGDPGQVLQVAVCYMLHPSSYRLCPCLHGCFSFRLVLDEGGLALMEEILNENSFRASVQEVKEWAGVVRANVVQWQETGDSNVDNLEFDG